VDVRFRFLTLGRKSPKLVRLVYNLFMNMLTISIVPYVGRAHMGDHDHGTGGLARLHVSSIARLIKLDPITTFDLPLTAKNRSRRFLTPSSAEAGY
jgi:hypothetical protein